MSTENPTSVPFDEQAALEELERLQHAIQETRRLRGKTVDEFDAFLRSFKSAPSSQPHAEPDRLALQAPVIPSAPAAATPEFAASPAPTPAQPTRGISSALVIGGGVCAIGAAGLLMVLMRPRPAVPSQPQAATETRAPVVETPAASSRPAAASAPSPARTGMQAEIVALRPVWVRVTADGRRVVERELKVNERVPVTVVQSMVVRAGDAGALRVSIGGQDQGRLGADGVVVSRTFTAGSAHRPAR